MEIRKLDIGWGTLWRIFAFILIIFILFTAKDVIGALFIAIVISIGIDPFVTYLEKYKLPRLFGAIVAFITGLFVLALVVYFVMPVVTMEVGGFMTFVNAIFSSFSKVNISLPGNFNDTLGLLGSAGASVSGVVQVIFGNVLLFLLAIVSAFYLTVEKNGPERFLMNVLSKKHEDVVLHIFDNFKTKIRRWFFGQLLLSLITFAIVSSGLWLIGVPYPIAIGIVAGVLELIPMIGPTIAGAVGILVALASSVSLAFYTFIFFVFIQQIDGNIFYPYIMGRTARVHPLIVILSILIGWGVAGLMGVILAVPSAVMAQEIVSYISENKSTD